MIITLSPAKTLDFSTPGPSSPHSMPEFGREATPIAEKMKKLTVNDLGSLLGISSKLAYLNHDRYQQWSLSDRIPEGRQAILAYKGDVYNGLRAWDLKISDHEWAQDHLRILSGLYGMLRPLDLIMPYRLEFATKLQVGKYKNLYEYWNKQLNRSLESLIQTEGSGILVDLASAEYSKALNLKDHKLRVITPVFKEYRNGEYRFLSMFGKKARGMMARYIIQNKLEDPEGIKLFDDDGYSFNEQLSGGDEWVFTR